MTNDHRLFDALDRFLGTAFEQALAQETEHLFDEELYEALEAYEALVAQASGGKRTGVRASGPDPWDWTEPPFGESEKPERAQRRRTSAKRRRFSRADRFRARGLGIRLD